MCQVRVFFRHRMQFLQVECERLVRHRFKPPDRGGFAARHDTRKRETARLRIPTPAGQPCVTRPGLRTLGGQAPIACDAFRSAIGALHLRDAAFGVEAHVGLTIGTLVHALLERNPFRM